MADSRRFPAQGPATIGPYTVLGELGRGGMGTVYRARDTRLGRDVALKVLPDELRLAPERVARFEHEARIVAALNHPNIAALFGIEDGAEGIQALVLELVEGKSLAARLAEGRLGVTEALDIARQVAHALDAAHEKGVVHRDLKPANIVITRTGLVKVLDFGVAKMTDPTEAASADVVTATLTREGVIVGTPAYMSPEQARGQTVDKRTDLWAFGCVLYEMLTGVRAFDGGTSSDTLAAVLSAEPDWTRLPAGVPSTIRTLSRRCLERESFKRIADIAAVRFALEDVASSPAEHQPGSAAIGHARRLTAAVWLLGGALAGAVAVAAWSSRATTEPLRVLDLHRLTDFVGIEDSPAISPDGKLVAFVRTIDGLNQIWIRAVRGTAATQRVTALDGRDHQAPRWLPDSTSFIYFTPSAVAGEEGTLSLISIFGGDSRQVTTAIGGGDISHDGQRIACFKVREGRVQLAVVSRDGALISSQALRDGGQLGTVRWSPDDKSLAFQRSSNAFAERLFISDVASGESKEVASATNIKGFAWLPDGSGLVYGSSDGSTVLYPPIFNLRTVSRDGINRPLTFGDDSYTQPDISLAGNAVATRTRMQSDVWKIPTTFTALQNVDKAVRITHQTGLAQTPSVSPDGAEVAYLSDSGGHGNIWIARTDGSGEPRQLTLERDPAVSIGVPVWSPVGRQIVYIVTKDRKTGLSLIDADSGGPRIIVPDGIGANWSDDGRWLHYSVIRNGTQCVEKILVPDGPPQTVRCDGLLGPKFGRDGTTMFFTRYMDGTNGTFGSEIVKATPPGGPAVVLARIPSGRIPVNVRMLAGTLSHSNAMIALPLIDGQTGNVWGLPTTGESMRQLTDFGDRAVVIARRVSWSSDDRFIYAAIAEVDSAVVSISLTGLRTPTAAGRLREVR